LLIKSTEATPKKFNKSKGKGRNLAKKGRWKCRKTPTTEANSPKFGLTRWSPESRYKGRGPKEDEETKFQVTMGAQNPRGIVPESFADGKKQHKKSTGTRKGFKVGKQVCMARVGPLKLIISSYLHSIK